MSYTIAPDGKSITCHQCGLTSHNLHDVRHRFCGKCNVYHDDVPNDRLGMVMVDDPTRADVFTEFDCRECGRHIVSLAGPRPALDGSDRCAACMGLPGWFNNPEIARMIDPDGDARPGMLQ